MLYDPKWQNETKADPYTLQGFIAWLEQQPADEHYNYYDICGCVAHQYLVSTGARGADGFSEDNHTLGDVFSNLHEYHFVAGAYPWTFGAALERARFVA